MTRELLQQALDALDRAIAAETIRAHLAAQPAPGEPVALESVHLTRDINGMCTVRVNGRIAIHDNGDIIDHMATLEWFAQPAPVVPLTDERITKALRRAFSLGQTYWQQADSDSYKQNAKSDETRQKFETLIVETLNGITGGSK